MQQSFPQYEQGPIRPPSEAYSLLIRITRNCPWNRCTFCPVYKGQKFSRRSMEEIKGDIDTISSSLEELKELSWKQGYGGAMNQELFQFLFRKYPGYLNLAAWLYSEDKSVFLQDADSMNLKGEKLAGIIYYLRHKIPEVGRITTYTRSKTIVRWTPDELQQVREAGLTRVHIGLETGSDPLLEFMQKGVSAAEHIESGLKIKEAGLSLSEYVLMGLGGRERWREHARETALVLNAIDPHYIRMRTLSVAPFTPLADDRDSGVFTPLDDEGIVLEEKLFIESLHGITSNLLSDHANNLLEDIQGVFPGDKEALLGTIEKYLSLPDDERALFRLGRRTGLFRRLEDMNNRVLYARVEGVLRELQGKGITVEDFITDIRTRSL